MIFLETKMNGYLIALIVVSIALVGVTIGLIIVALDDNPTEITIKEKICQSQTWRGVVNIHGYISIEDNAMITIEDGTQIFIQDTEESKGTLVFMSGSKMHVQHSNTWYGSVFISGGPVLFYGTSIRRYHYKEYSNINASQSSSFRAQRLITDNDLAFIGCRHNETNLGHVSGVNIILSDTELEIIRLQSQNLDSTSSEVVIHQEFTLTSTGSQESLNDTVLVLYSGCLYHFALPEGILIFVSGDATAKLSGYNSGMFRVKTVLQ